MELLLGEDSPLIGAGAVASCQAISGTGGLRLLAEFIAQFLPPNTTVLLSDPTWPNHPTIFREVGMSVKYHKYWDKNAQWVDFAGMKVYLVLAMLSVDACFNCSMSPNFVRRKPISVTGTVAMGVWSHGKHSVVTTRLHIRKQGWVHLTHIN